MGKIQSVDGWDSFLNSVDYFHYEVRSAVSAMLTYDQIETNGTRSLSTLSMSATQTWSWLHTRTTTGLATVARPW